jgi:sugar phosphate isomerase/epimerase
MQIAASTYFFASMRLHAGMLEKLNAAGAEAIEVFAARGHFDYTDHQQVREIAAWFQHNPVPFHSLHAPIYTAPEWDPDRVRLNLIERDKGRRIAAMDEIKRALEVAEVAPFRYLIQHLGGTDEAFDDYQFENALSSIEHLHAFAKPLGVRVLVENIPNEISTPARLVHLLDTLHLPDLGICFDLGHAHLMSSAAEAFATLAPHICSVHVHDNHREKDEHLFPGDGTIDWKQTAALLRTAPLVPTLVLEIRGGKEQELPSRFGESCRHLRQAAEAAAGA